MPRAATSVATSTSTLPLRNARSACSRAPWPRSPCTAADGEAAVGQLVGDLGGGALGAAEDHGQAAALGLQDAGEHLDLVHRVRAEDVLLDRLDGLGRRRRRRRRGCASAASCSGGPARRPRPAWSPRTASSAAAPAVTVERSARRRAGSPGRASRRPRRAPAPDVAEVEVALLGQVEQPAGGADDDVDALASAPRPAARRRGRRRRPARGRRALAGGLRRSSATWTHSSRVGTTTRACGLPACGRCAGRASSGRRPLQQRDAEAEGLAGAGLGLADDVVPAEGDGQRQRLDREGRGDADGLEGVGGLGEDPECGR